MAVLPGFDAFLRDWCGIDFRGFAGWLLVLVCAVG